MKKLFIFFTAITILTLSSCSKDDNNTNTSTKSLKANINGADVTFDTFKVDKVDYPDEGYSDLTVTATKSDDETKTIIFNLEYNVIGKETCYFFSYQDGEDLYVHESENETFEVNITENSENGHIKGTFVGTISGDGTPGSVTIPNGNFDITY